MTRQTDLIAYIFEGKDHQLSAAMTQWMDASPRYIAFVETYRDKIRKKVRITRDLESMLDLYSELEVAHRLLNDRRLVVAYEPYASKKRRGPDYAVTYRNNLVFNIEVARIRREEKGNNELDRHRQEGHILRILLDKLGQMHPGMANLLVIRAQSQWARSIDLIRLMQAVKARVEGTDPSFYAASRYDSSTAFYKDFLHLSGILLGSVEMQVWVNKQARPALSEKVFRLVSSRLDSEINLERKL